MPMVCDPIQSDFLYPYFYTTGRIVPNEVFVFVISKATRGSRNDRICDLTDSHGSSQYLIRDRTYSPKYSYSWLAIIVFVIVQIHPATPRDAPRSMYKRGSIHGRNRIRDHTDSSK